MSAPVITVVGSINLDLVATAETLPSPGETVTGAVLGRHPGGKGANLALAARRLGGDVRMIGRVGADAMAEEALALLRAEGVDLSGVSVDLRLPTAVALIAVAAGGENQIVVASGANMALTPDDLPGRLDGALILQLEVPLITVEAAMARTTGLVCINLAPAAPVHASLLDLADLLVVNQIEAEFYGDSLHGGPGLVAVTHGARGASLYRAGALVCETAPPTVSPIDTTGAGDTFVAALLMGLLEGMSEIGALAFACTAAALSTTRPGAQTAIPTRAQVEEFIRS